MSIAQPRQSREVCHRCFQPVLVRAARCANCGERIHSSRQFPILVGILGMVTLVFVIIIMYQVVRKVDIESAPPEQQRDNSGLSKPGSGSEAVRQAHPHAHNSSIGPYRS